MLAGTLYSGRTSTCHGNRLKCHERRLTFNVGRHPLLGSHLNMSWEQAEVSREEAHVQCWPAPSTWVAPQHVMGRESNVKEGAA
jgi:hypothetical protein